MLTSFQTISSINYGLAHGVYKNVSLLKLWFLN
jgi:hypothetical protein